MSLVEILGLAVLTTVVWFIIRNLDKLGKFLSGLIVDFRAKRALSKIIDMDRVTEIEVERVLERLGYDPLTTDGAIILIAAGAVKISERFISNVKDFEQRMEIYAKIIISNHFAFKIQYTLEGETSDGSRVYLASKELAEAALRYFVRKKNLLSEEKLNLTDQQKDLIIREITKLF